MMKKVWVGLLLGVSMSASMGVSAESVEIRDGVDEQSCRMVKQEMCSTTSRDGVAHCRQEHLKSAAQFGANRVVIGTTDQSDHKKRMANGLYTSVTKTRMKARYFACDETSRVRQPAAVQGGGKSIEERLLRLESLRQKHLLTEPEYTAKRAAILDDL
ncbi:hypothetical protein [Candidatus Thalassolituus haligoni]|jgi:hypothetical protein|uniref:hypothetical protein n=1 Tax=Candidatus Thalassolituus haligoni TaxID=3100113 RepID=UPI003514BCAD